MTYCGTLAYGYSALMDKLTSSQTQSLLRQLLQAPPSSLLNTSAAQASSAANTYGKLPFGGPSLSLQIPPALRQIIAQAQSPAQLLQSLATMRDHPDVAPNVRALMTQVLSQAHGQAAGSGAQPSVTPALVSAWFGLNPAAALLSPGLLGAQASAQSSSQTNALWLQQALPLLLLLLRPQTATGNKATPNLAQALGQLFGGAGQTAAMGTAMSQLLRDLQGALQHVRMSQVLYADTATRNEPDYFLTLPWQVGEEARLIELLLQKRQQQRDKEQPEEVWVLSMRLQITRIGPILARVRWNGEKAAIMLYTDNDAASRWLTGKVQRLQNQLVAKNIHVHSLDVQTGRIPASLAPDPNQLIRVKV